jgi:hypothetical protein
MMNCTVYLIGVAVSIWCMVGMAEIAIADYECEIGVSLAACDWMEER